VRAGATPGAASCTLLTTAANAKLREVHDRMPVILDPADYAIWLPCPRRETLRGPHAELARRSSHPSAGANDPR
jgi:putative SOS response-associated peptidase YedK